MEDSCSSSQLNHEPISFSQRLKEITLNMQNDPIYKNAPEQEKLLDIFEEDLLKGIAIYEQRGQEVLNSSKDKDIFISFGNTGAGKSTLCNLLIGNLLIPQESGYHVQKTERDSFKIGQGCQSQTLLPQYISSNEYFIFDLPGIGDTRGDGTAFLNAACIKNILTNARSVCSLFVQGKGSFETQRAKSFKRLLDVTLKILLKKEQFIGSSALIITKCNTDKISRMNKFLKQKIDQCLYESLQTLFNLKNEKECLMAGFLHSDQLLKDDSSDDDDDDDGCPEIKDKFIQKQLKMKSQIQKVIKKLVPIKITEENFNPTALLNPGTELYVKLFLKRKCLVIIFDSIKKIAQIEQLDSEGIKKINQSIQLTITESFIKSIQQDHAFIFIKAFDENLAKNSIEQSLVFIQKTITTLKISIQSLISKMECEQVRKKKQMMEQNLAEQKQKVDKMNEQMKEKDRKNKEQQEQIRIKLEKANAEEKQKLIQEQKLKNLQHEEEQKRRQKKAQEEVQKINNQLEAVMEYKKEMDQKKKQQEEKKRIEMERRQKEMKRLKEIQEIKSSYSCKQLDEKINSQHQEYEDLEKQVRELQRYIDQNTSAWKRFWTFKFNYNEKKKELQREKQRLSSRKDDLKKSLRNYQTMVLGQRHRYHSYYL